MTSRPLPPVLPYGDDWLPLINGGRVLLDPEDVQRFKHIRWYRTPSGYARCGGGGRKAVLIRALGTGLLHRLIIGAQPGQQVDHINRDRLDNRRENLRIASQLLNAHNAGVPANNRHGWPGVKHSRRDGYWVAEICVRGSRRYLGTFPTLDAAGLAYAAAKARVLAELVATEVPV